MTKSKTTKKKPSKSKPSPIKDLSLSQLQAELNVRHRKLNKLKGRREKLYEQIAEIDAELSSFGALGSTGAVLRRPKNAMNLVDSIAVLLDGKTMSVTDISELVIKRGYKTTAANFRTIVNQALIRETNIFKKISRGQYTAR